MELTPEKAMEIVSSLKGEEGLVSLLKELDNAVLNRNNQIQLMQAEIKAYLQIRKIVQVIIKRSGLNEIELENSSIEDVEVNPVKEEIKETAFDIEKNKRILEGKCVFKSNLAKGGKWCELDADKESGYGYCKKHAHEMGLIKNG